jgi:hypothetical protein
MSCRTGPDLVTEEEIPPPVAFNGYGYDCWSEGHLSFCAYQRPKVYFYNKDPIVRTTKLKMDRRPRPSNLIGNPTCQKEQSTVITYPGVREYKTAGTPPVIHFRDNFDEAYWYVPPFLSLPNWQNDLRRNINNKVGAAIGETAFEAKESIRGLYKSARWFWRLYRCVRSLGLKRCGLVKRSCGFATARRRSEANGRKDFLKALSCVNGAELGAKFSIGPTLDLMIDMHDRHRDRKHGHILRVVGGGRASKTFVNPYAWPPGRAERTITITQKAVCYLALHDDAPVWHINPVQTAWELVPLSFVLDWLVDLGSELEAMMLVNRKHYEYLSGTVTTQKVERAYYSPDASWYGEETRIISPWREISRTHKRDLITVVPSYRLKPPDILSNPSWGKLQTALQLLFAITGGKRPKRGLRA